MKNLLLLLLLSVSVCTYAQVDTSYIYNPNTPYGTLDIRIAKSSTRYYYLEENKTFSFRQDAAGQKTNTFKDMTGFNSAPYTEGNLRERNGTSNTFIMNYRLLFPTGYQPAFADGYPLIVMMHGAGERGNCWDQTCHWADRTWRPSSNQPPAPTSSSHSLLNNDHNLIHGGSQHLDARNRAGSKLPGDPTLHPQAFPGFVLFGQNLNGWDTGSTQDMIRLVRLVAKKYNINPNRIYVHGLSNGGIATYDVIKRAPWLFAAALPMSSPSDASITTSGLLPVVAHIPLWIFQGGKDINPPPTRTQGYVRKFKEAGLEVRYNEYPNLAHGTWGTAYAEPDFFSWIRSKSKTQIHVFYGNTSICGTTGSGVKLGLSPGFLAYQWQRDGSVISGATGNDYVATQPGVYRVRFSRESKTPSSSQWEEWSAPVTVTSGGAGKATIIPLTTTHLRGPDNAGPNTIILTSQEKAERYYWYKNGTLINIPNNNEDDTVSIYTITSTSTTNNGAYTLKTGNVGGCQSAASDPVNLFFNNSAPLMADANIPGSFRMVSVTGSTANLTWDDRSTTETAYEIWRRAPGGSFEFAGRTNANTESFTDRGLVPSTTYDYKIRALNNQGRSKYAPGDAVSSNLVVTTQNDTDAPSAPTNLKVVRNTINSISLSWSPSNDANGVKHYVVYYGSQSKVTGSTDPAYTLTGLPMNTGYNITVKAVDFSGLSSPASNQVSGTTSVTGLWYGHSTGAWTWLDNIDTWEDPEFTGWVPNFTLAPRTQEDYFNFEFDGYLFIETAGSYHFYLNSDDGSRLYIDGVQVVNFDGVHGRSGDHEGFGMRTTAPIALSAGPHEIRVIFFEYITGQSLSVSYQGADTKNVKMAIPDAALTSGTATGTSNNAPVVNITNPDQDQQFTAPASVGITATASDSDGNVAKVEFYNGTTKLGEDLSSPYAFTWNNVAAGNYTIMAKATDNDGATNTSSVEIAVTGSSQGCAGAGSITHEMWTGIPGSNISAIPQTTQPNTTGTLTVFETPENVADSYGRRIRGYICAPTSGSYVFWISGNDRTELWLSTDGNPANKRRIAYTDGYTGVKQWDKFATQKSSSIALVANQKYYIEALHKELEGLDHVAVGWQLPGGTLERPIPGMRLIPFDGSSSGGGAAQPVVSITNPDDGQSFTAPASVSISANATISEGSITKVEFYNGSTKLGEDLSSPYAFTWNNVSAGNYTIVAKATGSGGAITSSSVDIAVTSSQQGCEGAGSITHEMWTGIPGDDISSIPQDTEPSTTSVLTVFETPQEVGDYYGRRIRGYICAPTSGNYVFWISGNDKTELWLSTDGNPANKRRIAYTNGFTYFREWTRHATQQSAPIALVANQRYYIEALHKEMYGKDNLSVGWQLPGGTLERPIPGMRLIPFDGSSSGGGEAQPMVSITMPDDGQTFTAPASVTISANASVSGGSITKVEFYNGSSKLGEDLSSPYAFTWNNVSAGNYTIVAKATDNNGATVSSSVDIAVTSSQSQACQGAGSITHEMWTGIPGDDISSIPQQTQPTTTGILTVFETPQEVADYYGRRIRGYICAPTSGNYVFWISGNDKTELWLSTDDNPANKRRIAHTDGFTYFREWNRHATQQSAPVALVANQSYYIEALHKEMYGKDHVSVGWQLPGGALERPIPGNRLSPFGSQTAFASTMMMTEANMTESENMMVEQSIVEEEAALQVYPNPAPGGISDLVISGYQGTDALRETKVEILRMTGELVYSKEMICTDGCDGYSLVVDKELSPGVYLVTVFTNGKRHSKRLLIK